MSLIFKNRKSVTKDENSSSSSEDIRRRYMKRRLIYLLTTIISIFGFILLIIWIISLFRKETYNYRDVEKTMKNAAIMYFKDNKSKLPSDENQIVEITDKTLSNNNYMKPLSKYVKSNKCSGKVTVQKDSDGYLYVPYLNCDKGYTTKSLYETATANTVDSGAGLYNYTGTYVYRGEAVNNYVQLDNNLWRIVKITSDHRIVLISDFSYLSSYFWDDRYNVDFGYNSGINNYRQSRIKDHLNKLYNYKVDTDRILSDADKTKLSSFDLCVGKRSVNSVGKDNSLECSDILSDQKIGLLTVSDYLNASIDPNCNNLGDYSCQNYNYLYSNYKWLLVTASSDNSKDVFVVDDSGVVHSQLAAGYGRIRPVVYLNNSVTIKDGDGSFNNPYLVN